MSRNIRLLRLEFTCVACVVGWGSVVMLKRVSVSGRDVFLIFSCEVRFYGEADMAVEISA